MIHGHGGNIYALAQRLGCSAEDIVDMSSNINPLGMMPGMLDHLKAHLGRAGRLPEVDGRSMVEAMARLLEVAPDCMLAGNGTTQFIYNACAALQARKVLIVGPTYADYADACRMYAIEPRYCLWDPERRFQADLDRLHRDAADMDLVFICNPNNPTGGLIATEQLHQLCERHPRTVFIIDESYLSFAPEPQSMSQCGLDNVLVLWSASKIFGIPGLRAGFLIAGKDVVSRFRHYAQPWCVNSLAQEAIGFLGRHKDDVRRFIRRTAELLISERRHFTERLEAVPMLTVFGGVTSYLLIRLPDGLTSQTLCRDLAQDRLLIRDCSNFHGLSEQFVRVSLKTSDLNRQAAEHIASAIGRRMGG